MTSQDLDANALLNAIGNASADSDPSPSSSRREPLHLLRRIPVRLTLEVGSATLALSELMSLEHGSVIELDRPAGEPLLIKVNGTQIGQAEVVAAGDNYALKIVELDDLGSLTP
ncbi:flagellar motor switch protein FliN [Xanthomonas campestris pv. phormiicola]|nr:flagellar motor switch protein FliN [Xanthomonas campestris pv. phormiicola]UYC17859.1 flagellar motor switch protein FliN [Xanthomonas campestris pv. phormiicola]